MSKYTPGPWQRSSLAPLYIIAGNEPAPICSVGEYKSNGEIDGVFENAEANASLIATAPELLEAAKLAFGLLDTGESTTEPLEIVAALREAIVKAEGKESV